MGKKTTPTYRRSGIYGSLDVLEKESLCFYYEVLPSQGSPLYSVYKMISVYGVYVSAVLSTSSQLGG